MPINEPIELKLRIKKSRRQGEGQQFLVVKWTAHARGYLSAPVERHVVKGCPLYYRIIFGKLLEYMMNHPTLGSAEVVMEACRAYWML